MPTITVDDGTKINYYLDDFTDPWKESETILLTYGCGATAKTLYRLVPGFVRRYRVLRVDERGRGESSIPPGGYEVSLERFAEDVLSVMDQLGISKINYFGFQSGGWVGIMFAILYPDRTKSLIICNTPYRGPTHRTEDYYLGEKDVGTAIRKMGFKEWAKRSKSSFSYDLPPEMLDWFNNERGGNPTEVEAARYEFAMGFDCWEDFPKIKVPTLIITGANCVVCSPEMAAAMQQRIPNAQLAVIENAASTIPMSQPDRATEVVLNFLQRIGLGSKDSLQGSRNHRL